MARKAEAIFELAVENVRETRPENLEQIREMDSKIDALEIKIDNMCMDLLLKDPYAVDFRYIVSTIKTIKELERVGDQSKTIAKWARKFNGGLEGDMKELADKTREALRTATEALIQGEVADAERVMELEFQVDAIEDRIIESTSIVSEAFIAKALERIGDLATNIAENVIFYVKARDIRHGGYADS